MRALNLTPLRRSPLRRSPLRRSHALSMAAVCAATAVTALASATAAVAAGSISASPSPIGTGAVVIDTNLAFQQGEAAGTGIVLSSTGEVLTNNHVIRGARTIRIVLPGAGHSYVAKVVGYDVSADVAVLQAQGASDLKTIALGDSSTLRIGDAVTAVGNAGGTGSLKSGSGTVTGLRRSITVSDDHGGSESLSGMVVMNAPIQPGDSGGPLLNSAGQVVGMDTAGQISYKLRRPSSINGYAIPIDRAASIATQIEEGRASAAVHVGGTAFLGVATITTQQAGPGSAARSGAAIAELPRGGPAAAAGLRAGDTITALDGRTVTSPTGLGRLILSKQPGIPVSIRFVDSTGVRHTISVTLGTGPPQ